MTHDGAVTPEPFRHRVRAWRGGDLVVDTTAARRLDEPGRAPVLLVPGEGPDGDVPLDHDALRVEVDDGGDPKRFPTWGDARDLCGLLDVRPAGEGRYVSAVRDNWARPVVEGSQILGQAIVAGGRHTGGRRPVSSWMAFTRVATTREPVEVDLEDVAAGRTFTTLAVRARQGSRVCAAGSMLLDVTAPDVIRHHVDPPDVPAPEGCPPVDMAVTGRDIRVVDGAYTGDPDAPIGPPQLDAWVRFHELPDDPILHAGLIAQFTGHLSIAAALRPHPGVGQDQAHRTLSTAINAISIAFHREARADQWLLYHHHSTAASDGMTHAECRVHDRSSGLVASFTVDAMVRGFADPTSPADERTAL